MLKKLLRFTFFLVFSAAALGQAPEIGWKLRYGHSGDRVNCVRQTADGGFISCGTRPQQIILPGGGTQLFSIGHVARISASGELLWTYSYGGSFNDYLCSVVPLENGGFFAVGNSNSIDGDVMGSGIQKIWGIWLDAMGTVVDHKILDTSTTYSLASDMKRCADGGYIICGAKQNGALLLKINASGDLLWQKTFPSQVHGTAQSVIECNSGGYVIAGHSGVGLSTDAAFAIKTDENGNQSWLKMFDGNGQDIFHEVTEVENGNILLAGATLSSGGIFPENLGVFDALIVKLDASGNQLWLKTFGAEGYDEIEATAVANDGGYYFCGHTGSFSGLYSGNHSLPEQSDFQLAKTTVDGNLQWVGCYGGTLGDFGKAITTNAAGQVILAGLVQSTDGQSLPGTGGSWILNLGPDLGMEDTAGDYLRIYPNPVRDELHFSYGDSTLEDAAIIDLNGRVLRRLGAGVSVADLSDLASGIYILECRSENRVLRSRLIKR